jgi:hypothetical protein
MLGDSDENTKSDSGESATRNESEETSEERHHGMEYYFFTNKL